MASGVRRKEVRGTGDPAYKTHLNPPFLGGICIGRPFLTHSTFHPQAKIFPSQKMGLNLGSQKFPTWQLEESFLKGKVSGMKRRIQLTDREWKWLWEYTRTGSNASHAARIVYGGTPISVRVKGHKKKVKLKPILDRIDKIWDQFLVRKPDGHLFLGKKTDQIGREMDTYLKRLKRRIRKNL